MGPIQYNKFLPKLCATPSKRKIKFKMEFRFFFILSLGLMANGLPTKTKTGAELRASDYFDTTNLRSGDQSANPNVTFPVRLIHGASGIVGGKSGRLEVHISGQWRTVWKPAKQQRGTGRMPYARLCRWTGCHLCSGN